MKKNNGPRILLFDIETSPLLVHAWQLWGDQNIGVNQMIEDWQVLSWSAKWLKEDNIMYRDQRKSKKITNDKELIKEIWKLLDEADVVITQNGKKFDVRKLNAKFVENELGPPSSFKHIDTRMLAKAKFDLPSYSLEYMTKKFCKKYKKLKSRKFIGHDLWIACIAGNLSAWKEMEAYNKTDVLALEELYHFFKGWDDSINLNLYSEEETKMCNSCGHSHLEKKGFSYTGSGKFQRYRCAKCGHQTASKINLLSKEKRASIRKRA